MYLDPFSTAPAGVGIKSPIRVKWFMDFFLGEPVLAVPVPAEWLSSPPVVAAALFICSTPTKGGESLGCCRMGVIGALVLFFLS